MEDDKGGFLGERDQRLGSLVRGERHWRESELFCRIRLLTQWDPHVAKRKLTGKRRAMFKAFSSSHTASLQVYQSFEIHVVLKVCFFLSSNRRRLPYASYS